MIRNGVVLAHGGSVKKERSAGLRPRHTPRAALGALACIVVYAAGPPGCRRPEPQAPPEARVNPGVWFEDVVDSSGVSFVHTSGHTGRYWFPEISIGGVGLLDYDGDGYLDIYFVQGGGIDPVPAEKPPNRLYRNKGDWTFEDVTVSSGTGDTGYGSGCTCADYDGDSDVDIYVTNLGPNVLYRNNGDGTFTNVTASAGVGDASGGASSAFVDYNRDGALDLFIANYLHWSKDKEIECFSASGHRDYCNPMNYRSPARDTLYRNRRDGTFEDVSAEAGLTAVFGNGLGVACADYNLDGRVDIYVANDGMPNQLWLNRGNNRFEDDALFSGCAVNGNGMSEAGMGVAAVDLHDDGDFDLFMSHLRGETNTLYVNQGGVFDDATSAMGVGAPSLGFTGFGLGFADYDNDGRLDLYVANGSVRLPPVQYDAQDPFAQPNLLFRGTSDGRFEEVMPRGGTSKLLVATSRGAAFGDLDNDGDVDIVVANKDAKPHLLRNIAPRRGNWVQFRVLDRNGGDALGAVLRVEAGHRKRWYMAQAGYSYCASNDPRVHVGLGEHQRVDAVNVRWPDGTEEAFGHYECGKTYELRRGTGK
ncbi:MAG: CRTAC1 family protein [Phycisphaerae bacterium]